MADQNILEMTQLAVAPAANDALYIGDVSEAVDDDKNKYIEISDLFEYLNGTWDGSLVLDATGTLDLQAGTVYLNEAVDLTATSSDLNQFSGLTVGGTGSGDIVTTDDTQTLTNKTISEDNNTLTITTLAEGNSSAAVNDTGTGQFRVIADGSTIADFETTGLTISTGSLLARADTDSEHTIGRGKLGYDGTNSDFFVISHYDQMGTTGFGLKLSATGNTAINCASATSIEFQQNGSNLASLTSTQFGTVSTVVISGAPNTDTTHVLGRARIGYDGSTSDEACFAHYDRMSTTDFAVRQQANGATRINAASGLTISFQIAGTTIASVNGSALNINNAGGGYLNARPDADVEHILGKAKVGYDGASADVACFSHYDQMAAASFALSQNASGATIVNAATGQTVSFNINDSAIFDINASGLQDGGAAGARITQFDNDDTMAADSATRGVTQAAVKGYVDGRTRYVTIPVFDAVTAVTTGEKGIVVITPDLNGLDLTNVIVGVWDKGVTGSTDVGIYRSRGGTEVAMLSTEVTVGDEWYAQDGVINTTNDDVATGDLINVNISGIHSGTAPNGLTVTLEFS